MKIERPIFCDIGITENCISRCKMCKFWQSATNPNELSTQEWKDFIVSLEEFGSNDIRLHFIGGEPLTKKGILDIIGFAHQRGFFTAMGSNGFLIDEAMAEKIAHSGLDVVSISLDSLDAKIHDFLRGVEGAFRKATQAIDYLNKQRTKSISILTIIMGPTLDGLIKLTEWVNSNDALSAVYFQAIAQPIATPKDEVWYQKEEFAYLWPKDSRYVDSIIDQLIEFKNKGYKISNSIRQLELFKIYFKQPQRLPEGMVCTQGDYVIYVRPTGNVFLCCAMAPVGNIKTDNIRRIWHSQEAILRRQQIYNCKESCLNVINCFENKDLP